MVQEYFTIENIGIKVPNSPLESTEDKRARQIMEDTAIYKNQRYEIGLLWRHNNVNLPDSYPMARSRLLLAKLNLALLLGIYLRSS